jgi:hypothetical protein
VASRIKLESPDPSSHRCAPCWLGTEGTTWVATYVPSPSSNDSKGQASRKPVVHYVVMVTATSDPFARCHMGAEDEKSSTLSDVMRV